MSLQKLHRDNLNGTLPSTALRVNAHEVSDERLLSVHHAPARVLLMMYGD